MTISIGLTQGTLMALSAFSTPIPTPTVYYTDSIDSANLSNGGRVRCGSALIRWTFALLELPAMRNQLKALITDLSGDVCIRCTPEGTEHDYNCVMVWPVPEPENNDGLGISLVLEFRRLVQL